jgi:uncharacterized phage-associated protein
MANVYDVANFFINIVIQSDDDHITNMKLNKLVYYAQGCHLARTGQPLFENNIEAWDYGPVVPAVYHKYKVCGRFPITTVDDDFSSNKLSPDETEILIDVMREYGRYTGSALVTMTHAAETPWGVAHERMQTVIDMDTMKDYFIKHPVPAFSSDGVPSVDTLPKEWYDPTEDAEWEAYLCQ